MTNAAVAENWWTTQPAGSGAKASSGERVPRSSDYTQTVEVVREEPDPLPEQTLEALPGDAKEMFELRTAVRPVVPLWHLGGIALGVVSLPLCITQMLQYFASGSSMVHPYVALVAMVGSVGIGLTAVVSLVEMARADR